MATLRNFANNCYVNSIIQILRIVPGFEENLDLLCKTLDARSSKKKPVGSSHATDDDLRTAVVFELNWLLADLKKSDARLAADDRVGPIMPRRFIEALQNFKPDIDFGEQQDAVEILKLITDTVDNVSARRFEGPISFTATIPTSDADTNGNYVFTFKQLGGLENDAHRTKKNFVQENFWGRSAWNTKCSSCPSVATQEYKLMEVLLPIDRGEPNQPVTMGELISTVAKTETIFSKCPTCQQYVTTDRSFQFKELPPVLMINFGRFRLDHISGKTVKTTNKVHIPEVLDCFCEDCQTTSIASHRYTMFGMIVHTGFDLHSGHYMAYCKMEDGGWRRFNDIKCSVVSQMEFDHILQKAAYEIPYLLLYSK